MADPDTFTDAELAALALAGRQDAYRQLLARHRPAVYRIARHHCGDEDAALDITQQSFIAAFAALGRYDPARPFAHWIARITLNKCRDRGRRMALRRWLRFAAPIEDARDLADAAPSPETLSADRQALARAMAAVARLPANLKDVLVLRAIEGLPQAEVAQMLNITPKAVETRLYRAREKLSEMLRD
ncbi:sigma-70 family RNA polymerase sigma factor [Novosphingobium sp. FSY-8]|uniref:Sigma-70 family RNA polymerase sigma factor n=1 Tax=Novosphingobium ovatum TaxID=1908523 RepID=A0ABW9XD09_9SPHN|nr:sigma-70 family RNA polymerase sigma factor [Novosphingobium ovatum]NBC36424.1 sigma-70 family RNA polymerase sigma factor [Novosphingobium ovatum]